MFCQYVCVISFRKKKKEFKTALMISFILLLSKNVNIIMLINITTIDKTHNMYAASTYMILVMVIKHFHDLLMNYSCY